MISRPLAIALGLVADRVLGEPPTRFHPVAWFGSAMQRVETSLWPIGAEQTDLAPTARLRGTAYTATGLSLGLAAGAAVRSTTLALGVAVAGTELRRVAESIAAAVDEGGLDAARAELPSLVGRDPSELDLSEISAAVVESVAENSVDAVIAPIFWALVGGAAGAGAYRAINTMDAMVGHRSDRFDRFGTAAARLDDVANYLPARIFGGLMMLATPGSASTIVRIIRRDARQHPSPNAGVAESAMAAALGRQLGGPLRYGNRVENRPRLGDGPRPDPTDIRAANALSQRVDIIVCGLLASAAVLQWIQGARRM